MKTDPAPLFDRSTKTLCQDSLHLCYEAAHAPHEMASRTLARASFSATTMFLEASANTCLETLDASANLLGQIDKFPVVQKFEFFAQARFAKKINLGSHIIQQLNEIFAVRNRYVHPKAQRLEWKPLATNALIGVPKTSPALEIPLAATYFNANHAIKALKASHVFLEHVLQEVCGLGPEKVTAMLFSLVRQPVARGIAASPLLYSHMAPWLKNEGVSLEYMTYGFHS